MRFLNMFLFLEFNIIEKNQDFDLNVTLIMGSP